MYFKPLPQQQFLQECFDYNDNTGQLTWKERPRTHFNTNNAHKRFNNTLSGKIVGTTHKGRMIVRFTSQGKALNYPIGRLIFKRVIDHIDGNPFNNAWDNLRDISIGDNVANMHSVKRKGLQGVCYDKSRGKWLANIRIRGKKIYLGRFETEQEAYDVYMQAKQKRLSEIKEII